MEQLKQQFMKENTKKLNQKNRFFTRKEYQESVDRPWDNNFQEQPTTPKPYEKDIQLINRLKELEETYDTIDQTLGINKQIK